MKILITGIAGTGKSTIVPALQERGITAIDLHEIPGLCFWQNKKNKEQVEYTSVHSQDWFDDKERLCDIGRLKEILGQHDDIVIACTAGDSQKDYLPLFDKIILLQCSPEVLIHRLQTRTNKSGFGKTAAEQDDNIEWQKEFDPFLLSHGAIPVNTEKTLDEVVDEIIKIIKAT